MSKFVLVIATCDTKGPEAAYIRDGLAKFGINAKIADTGILGEPLEVVPDITHEELCEFGGTTLEKVRNAGTRGRAVEQMRAFITGKVKKLYESGQLLGAIGIGGAEGSVMAATALMALPIGVPKIVLSPIASGRHEFGPLVGTSDMVVMHTVIDILGLNHISKTIYDNAVACMAGWVNFGHPLPKPPAEDKYVAVSMLGNTTTAVMQLQKTLEKNGFKVITFHANGVGGPAMEELAELGQFYGVIDFTPSDVIGNLIRGIHDGGPERLKRVGKLGLPQIIVTTCVDFSVHHTSSLPEELKSRPIYDHNPEFALVRLNASEMEKVAKYIAESANKAKGNVEIAIPKGGYSIPNTPNGIFWDQETDAKFEVALESNLSSKVKMSKYPLHANSEEFGDAIANHFLAMIKVNNNR